MSKNCDSCNHAFLVNQLKLKVNSIEKERLKDKSISDYSLHEQLEEIPEILSIIEQVENNSNLSLKPNLPIDLICVEKIEDETESGDIKQFAYYIIYLVVSTRTIPTTLESRILFYKYYLSRIISSRRMKIVLITRYNTETVNKEFLDDNGIGFWRFLKNINDFKIILQSRCQREQMDRDFTESEPENIPRFFDKYVHDAVDAIAGVTPEHFGKRYIDKKLMDNTFALEKISYRKELSNIINEHLSEKGNEYEFVSEVFSKLWNDLLGIPYKDFLEKFEPGLVHVFAETTNKSGKIYRDHYLHQFQVFLMGLFIIDKLYKKFSSNYTKPEIIWLIVSSFHDIAYPVQLYDKWSGDFFNDAFHVPKEISHIELKSSFVDESFMCCTNSLVARLCDVFCKESLKGDWLSDKKELVKFFYKKITEAKNHSILSSISLIKMIQTTYKEKISINKMNYDSIYEKIFKPSAVAIAIHDKGIFNELRDEKKWEKLNEKIPIPILKFDDDPMSFLLIFCDNSQEWGRPSKSKLEEGDKRWKRFYLKDFKYDSKKGFEVDLWTPNNTKCEKFFQDKQNELGELEEFLQQPTEAKFTIRLKDKDGEGEDFTMKGISSKN